MAARLGQGTLNPSLLTHLEKQTIRVETDLFHKVLEV